MIQLSLTRRLLFASALTLVALWSHVASAADPIKLTFLSDNAPSVVARNEELIRAFQAANPDIVIETEMRPSGGEGDNIIKTRLATGEMSDLFFYQSGSLFQALNPNENLLDLSKEAYVADISDKFKPVVSVEGKIFGVPAETAMGGGVLYNKRLYASLGLKEPKTWAEFEANNAVIKKAGKVPVIQTFKDSWTSQVFVLADFFNLQAAEPNFAADYTANKVKFASSAAARKGFERQEEVFKNGYLNSDFASAGFEDGLRMVATGVGAHYPMLTFAVGSIAASYPDKINDVGFFALPGDNASRNGLTVWMPSAIYANKNTKHPAEVKRFLAFVASKAGCDAQTRAGGATGPYLINGCELPHSIPPAISDVLPYFADKTTSAPALEFLSPIKGPSLEQITVEVGSGIRSAADGAALYDEDVRKQAQQLGIKGW